MATHTKQANRRTSTHSLSEPKFGHNTALGRAGSVFDLIERPTN